MFHPATLRLYLRLSALTGFFLIPLVFFTPFRDQFELPKLALLSLLAFPIALGRLLAPGRRGITALEALILLGVVLQGVASLPALSSSWRTSLIGEYENFGGWLTALAVAAWFYGLGGGQGAGENNRRMFFLLTSAYLSALYALFQANGMDFIQWNPETYNASRVFASLGNPNFLSAFLAMALPWVFAPGDAAGRRPWGWTALGLPLSLLLLALSTGRWSPAWAGDNPVLPLGASLLGFVWLSAILVHPALRCGGAARGAGVLVLGGGLVAAGSRGGWLGAAAGLALFGFLRHGRGSPWIPRRAWLPFLGVMLSLVAVGTPFFARLSKTLSHPLQSLAESRLTIWEPALRMVQAHPLSGVGLDCFKIAFTSYGKYDFNALDGAFVSSRTAHNEWLQAAATCGVPCALVILSVGVLFVVRSRKLFRESGDGGRPAWAAVLSSGTAFLVQNLFSFSVATLSLFWAALLASVNRPREAAPLPRPRWFLIGLFLSAFVAWPIGCRMAADRSFASGMVTLGLLQRSDRDFTEEQAAYVASRAESLLGFSHRLFPLEVKYLLYIGMAREKTPGIRGQELSLHIYDQTVRWVPTNAYYHNNRGRVLLGLSRLLSTPPMEAELAFRQAVKYAPENPFFLSQWGAVLRLLDRKEESRGPLDRAFSFNRDLAAETLTQVGVDTFRLGNRKSGLDLLQEAAGRHPSSPKARLMLGWAHWQEGRPRAARADLDEAVRLNPDFAPYRDAILKEKK